jgi:hypothetical protein
MPVTQEMAESHPRDCGESVFGKTPAGQGSRPRRAGLANQGQSVPAITTMPARGGASGAASLVDEPAPLCVGHRLEAVMRAELAVDVVEVVTKRLGGNT